MEPEIKTEEENPSQKEQVSLVCFHLVDQTVRKFLNSRHFYSVLQTNTPEMNDCKEQQDSEITESVPALQTKPAATTAKSMKKNQKSSKEQKKAKEEEKRLSTLLIGIHFFFKQSEFLLSDSISSFTFTLTNSIPSGANLKY